MNHLVPVELNNESFKDYGHVISEIKLILMLIMMNLNIGVRLLNSK